ncbi:MULTISPECIES: acyltransferase [unclassified Acidovorax]|uniref:acyltransferase n=1 Tax=unclassified Acidovorax TaxID=2684926 RepID=UPI002883242B|nr:MULTISPECIES: acyltransferase [unclassified Acidovorax]
MLGPLKFLVCAVVLALNTVIVFSMMMPWALAKLVLPFTPVRRHTDRVLSALAELWIGINNVWIGAANRAPWQVSGLEGLSPRHWYLVTCNHQSWVDIVVLQRVFNRRIPLLKFFLKRELIYVPVIGLAWWALDFPFMRRSRGGASARKDLRAAREACEKFRRMPTAVMNFSEGTRFSQAKHDEQASPYRHLLVPRYGGMATVLQTLHDQLDSVLDVTIAYPEGVPTFSDALAGRMGRVIVHVEKRPVPAAPARAGARNAMQDWLDGLWRDKDARLDAAAQRPDNQS